MEPTAAQKKDDEEELMDIVAASSRGENGELRKLFELEAQQAEDELPKREEIHTCIRSFQSSQHDPSTTGSKSTGEEIKEEEKEDDAFILKVVQEPIQNHRQITTDLQRTTTVSLWGSWWLAGVHECQWGGISCEREKNVTELRLWNNGLNGPLPTELASLPALELIDLKGNHLTGTLPCLYGSFLLLSYFNLVNSQLRGSIPLELFGNKLSSIFLANNSLTGTVPTEVGLFELFRTGKGDYLSIYLNDNKLTGALPTEIGALHGRDNLAVHLQGNPLRGTIPSEIGLLKGSLRELDISRTHMDGSLPEELFTKCTNVEFLKASNCGLTGTISTGLQLLSKLYTFDICNNKFHGTIPAQLSALTDLRHFFVNGNNLSGSIPSSVCALADPLKGTFEVAADCLPRDGTGNPMLQAAS
ncbi:leucine Rich Repeat [Seminavis robusta]|uniref:Leucine Rich Repeat n=1 Tax=Seminavis robusta TaxID=568900 RepID=A0A9N8HPN0_9STRA|nr:leucine Rich Repeat [Seminavis robusta]|eukprot:Sro1085_g239600.1 leucine Rich Repeat (416) ;mRNA; r:14611-16572